jgi:beta-alanine--pyruvate transaminase
VIELESIDGKPGLRGYNAFMKAYDMGLYVRAAGENMTLAPAFVTTPAQFDSMVNILADAIRATA